MGSKLQTARATFDGVEDLRRAVAGGDLNAIQLKPGPFSGRMLHAAIGDALFSTGTFNGDIRVRGVMHQDRVTLGLMLDDKAAVSQWSFDAQAGDVFVFPQGCEQVGRFVGESFYATISLYPDRLHQLSEWEGASSRRTFWLNPHRCRASPHVRAAIRKSISDAAFQLEQPDIAMTGRRLELFERSLVDMFLTGVAFDADQPEQRSTYPGANLVRSAENWIDRNELAGIQTSDLSKAMKVSRRTLERAFHETLGVGPAHYLKTRRLAAVRSYLRNADPGATRITDAALDHGFWELGRFAVDYRRAFGEKPSETLHKIRPLGAAA